MQPPTKLTAAELKAQREQLNQQIAEAEAAEQREAALQQLQAALSNLDQQVETAETALRNLSQKASTLLAEKGQIETALFGG